MKYLLITHTDLDGISPIILMNLTKVKFDYKSVEIVDLEETFTKLLETNLDIYECIYITDLTLSENIYNLLNSKKIKYKVFDHHESHRFAENYKNVTVKVKYKNHLTCGTELFYNYLKKIYKDLNTKIINDYVRLVREIDTYTFTDNKPRELSTLMEVFGKQDFIKSITKRLKKDKETFEFTPFEKKYLKVRNEEINRYMESKEKKMFKLLIKGYKCGVVFAETNKSDLGQYLSLKHQDLDLIILIDASSRISYRTTKDNVRVNDFASMYKGGGHVKASGSSFTDLDRLKTIENYFGEYKKLDD